MQRHIDESLSGFTLSQGWCLCCSAVLRVAGVKWYGPAQAGPYCSTRCMREAGKQGSLPDHVREFRGVRASFPADLANKLVSVEPLDAARTAVAEQLARGVEEARRGCR